MEIIGEREAQENRIKDMDYFYEIYEMLKKINPNDEIGNIAIAYNNKVGEMVQLFKKKGIDNSLYQSVYDFIELYLNRMFLSGCSDLNNYAKMLNKSLSKNISDDDITKFKTSASNYLEKYKKKTEGLYNFSLEKDIRKVFKFIREFSYANDKGELIYQIDGLRVGYKEVLENLGCDGGIVDEIPHLKNEKYELPVNEKYEKYEKYFSGLSSEEHESYVKGLRNKTVEMKEYFDRRRVELEEEFKDTSTIAWALTDQLLYLYEKVSDSMLSMDRDNYELYVDRFEHFNPNKEMVESLGRHIAYWDDIQSFHGENEFNKVENDLKKIGMESLFPQIVKDVEDNKYADYVAENTDIIDDVITESVFDSINKKK